MRRTPLGKEKATALRVGSLSPSMALTQEKGCLRPHLPHPLGVLCDHLPLPLGVLCDHLPLPCRACWPSSRGCCWSVLPQRSSCSTWAWHSTPSVSPSFGRVHSTSRSLTLRAFTLTHSHLCHLSLVTLCSHKSHPSYAPPPAGAGTIVPSLTTIVSRFGDGDEKGRVMGIFRSLGALARALGPFAASTGESRCGSRTVLLGQHMSSSWPAVCGTPPPPPPSLFCSVLEVWPAPLLWYWWPSCAGPTGHPWQSESGQEGGVNAMKQSILKTHLM